MTSITTKFHKVLLGSVAGCALIATSIAAQAGGLAVREQSAQFQGSSFAGNGAGGGLSSSFWNSAAIGEAGNGLSSESNATLLMSDQEFTALPGTSPFISAGVDTHASADTEVVIPASYMAYRLSDTIVLGMAINSPFGVGTELDDKNSVFRTHHRSAKIFTINANPMASVEVMPGLFVGAGLQVQYFEAKFKVASGLTPGAPSAGLRGDDIGFGYTAGLLWKPSDSTSVGIGYRSPIKHTIEGEQFVVGVTQADVSVGITTPEMITASLRQKVSDSVTLLGTLEWTNWDRVGVLPINGPATGPLTGSVLDFQYHEGWFMSVGGEWEMNDKITLRAGAAYEISPVTKPSERLVQVPDADRIWLSFGGTYKVNPAFELNFGYTHVFIDDTTLDRLPANQNQFLRVVASAEPEADIVSVGMVFKFGGHEEEASYK